MSPAFSILFMIIITLIIMVVPYLILVSICYKKVQPGQVLIRSGMGGIKISYDGMIVYPILHSVDILDTSLKKVTVKKANNGSVICKDPIRADITMSFYIRINYANEEDVLWVLKTYGIKASHEQALQDLFEGRIAEVLDAVCGSYQYTDLFINRSEFKQRVLDSLQTDLNGFIVEDCMVDYLDFTDPGSFNLEKDIDCECVKNLNEILAYKEIREQEIKSETRKTILEQDLEAQKVIHELEQQQVRAEEQHKQEIAAIKAYEQSLTEESIAAFWVRQEKMAIEQEKALVEEYNRVKSAKQKKEALVEIENTQEEIWDTKLDTKSEERDSSHIDLLKRNNQLLEERKRQNEALIEERINRKNE